MTSNISRNMSNNMSKKHASYMTNNNQNMTNSVDIAMSITNLTYMTKYI